MEKGNSTIVSKTGKLPTSQVSSTSGGTSSIIPPDQRKHMIEIAAYYRAEHRGFQDGNPLQDWLEAEAEIERLMNEKRY